jgi:hypothetical protein
MCRVHFVLELCPFFSIRIEPVLSWYRIDSSILTPCLSRKCVVQISCGMTSCTPMASASVELRVTASVCLRYYRWTLFPKTRFHQCDFSYQREPSRIHLPTSETCQCRPPPRPMAYLQCCPDISLPLILIRLCKPATQQERHSSTTVGAHAPAQKKELHHNVYVHFSLFLSERDWVLIYLEQMVCGGCSS